MRKTVFALITLCVIGVGPMTWAASAPLVGVSLSMSFAKGNMEEEEEAARAIRAKWESMLSRMESVACPEGKKGCAPWHAQKKILVDLRDERLALLVRVNDALNRVSYYTDTLLWGVHDYWATPAETLARRAGDCEDYAIAKYFLLREVGVPADDMRIAVVRDTARKLTHAVLIVRTSQGLMMLDNVVEEVVPVSQVPQYRLLAAVNEEGLEMFLSAPKATSAE